MTGFEFAVSAVVETVQVPATSVHVPVKPAAQLGIKIVREPFGTKVILIVVSEPLAVSVTGAAVTPPAIVITFARLLPMSSDPCTLTALVAVLDDRIRPPASSSSWVPAKL